MAKTLWSFGHSACNRVNSLLAPTVPPMPPPTPTPGGTAIVPPVLLYRGGGGGGGAEMKMAQLLPLRENPFTLLNVN